MFGPLLKHLDHFHCNFELVLALRDKWVHLKVHIKLGFINFQFFQLAFNFKLFVCLQKYKRTTVKVPVLTRQGDTLGLIQDLIFVERVMGFALGFDIDCES